MTPAGYLYAALFFFCIGLALCGVMGWLWLLFQKPPGKWGL